MQYKALESTFYFHFGLNDNTGEGADGSTPLYDIRLCGAAAGAAPVYSGTPTLLTHADYPAGCFEIAIPATTANGFIADNQYAVFCTVLVSSVNPTGFVGEFTTTALVSDTDIDTILSDNTDIIAIKAIADILATMYENSTGYRWTAHALEEAPSGTGGDATAANQTTIINHLTGIKGGTWSDETLVSIQAALDAAYAIVNHADYGNAHLVRSTTPANTLTVDSSHRVLADLVSILATAITEGAAGRDAAAFTKFFDKATPTGTINSLPDAVPGANAGLPTTNGTKVNQTVDLTAGQSIAVSDKTGFSLSSAGILAIWDQLLTGLVALGSIGKKLADWVVGTIDTYTGNTKQTGDNYPIVSSGTYGNAALQTLIAALNNLSSAQAQAAADAAITANMDIDSIISALNAIAGYIDTEVAAIKAKTDQLVFTTTNKVDARVDYVGSNAVTTPDDFKANITTLATLADALTKYNDLVDKMKGLMSKNHTLSTAVGTFDPAADANEAIRDHGDTAWITGEGSVEGSNVVTLTFHDAIGTNIVEAVVELYDSGGTVLYERKLSNSSGQAVFNLDNGTYIVKIHKAGYSFDDETLVVDGTEAVTYTGTAASTANVKNLRYCQVLHDGEYYDVIIAVDTLDQVDDVLQEWALANEDIGEALTLPAELIQNEDIREVLTTKDIDGSVYVKS